jgi:predicted nucleic acid-binding protein
MVIVDTSVWIDFFNLVDTPQTIWLETAISREQVGLTNLILCEVLQGARNDLKFDAFARDLCQFEVFDTGSVNLAVASARNYRALRQNGFTIRRTIDCIIPTFCIEHGYQLLHHDRDFDAFERHLGLRVPET